MATGVLGAFWGLLYLTRGSIVAAAVSHGLFNFGQVVIAYSSATRSPRRPRTSERLGASGWRLDPRRSR